MRRSICLAVLAIAGCLALIGAVKFIVAWKRPAVPILVYHNVLRAGYWQREALSANAPVLSPNAFESNLAFLEREGYETVTLQEVCAFVEGHGDLPPKPIAITFDDGWEGVYRYAFPLLVKHKMKATVFLIAGKVQDPARRDTFTVERLTMLDWDQVRKMESSGLIDFESHTYDLHRRSNAESIPSGMPVAVARLQVGNAIENDSAYQRRLARDFDETDQVFERELGHRPRFIAWPFGAYTGASLDLARAHHYRASFTTDFGVDCPGDNIYALRRVSLSEHGAPNIAGAIAEARYVPEIYSLKQSVKALLHNPNDP